MKMIKKLLSVFVFTVLELIGLAALLAALIPAAIFLGLVFLEGELKPYKKCPSLIMQLFEVGDRIRLAYLARKER